MARNKVQYQKELSEAEFERRYGSEEQCSATVAKWRWPDGFVCPHCGGAGDQVVEQRPPGGLALAAHVAHRQQHLLAVAADAEDNEERDRRRLLVEPDTHDGAVEDQPDDVFLGERALRPGFPIRLHLPPDAADRILADRTPE